MAESFKILGQAQLSILPVKIYEVPTRPLGQGQGRMQAIIRTMNICNLLGSNSMIGTINVVKNGESAGERNRLFYWSLLTPNQTRTAACGITLSEGDSIIASSLTGTISISLFGVEMY
jgi:hypothetical protein